MHTKDTVRFVKPTTEIWSDTQKLLSKRLKVPTYQTLLSASCLTDFNNGEATLCVTNGWVRDRIVAECLMELERALSEVVGADVHVTFLIDESALKQYTATLASVTPEGSRTPDALLPAGFQQPLSESIQQFVDGGHPTFLDQVLEEPSTASAKAPPQEDSLDDVSAYVAEFEARQTTFAPPVPTPQNKGRVQQTAVDRALAMAKRVNAQSTDPDSSAATESNVVEITGRGTDEFQRTLVAARTGANDPQIGIIPRTTTSGQLTISPVSPAANPKQSRPAQAPESFDRAKRSNLNPKHTFGTFVIGPHNSFGHSAAKAVAKNPGQAYNPLFIYGGVGLGKTHLMQSIGNEILSQYPNATVRYISCELFTNEMIRSIREDRMAAFRARYRQVDVLLVDDIHFIEKKESTQEEFFHTFNALRDSGKQIVISADRPPKAFAHLAERLRSRFEWGLICDVQIPDYETRLAILQKKCLVERIAIDASALEYIASVFTTNIRELEGALIKANAYSTLTGKILDRYSLANILQPSGTLFQPKPVLTIDKVIATVAEAYKVEAGEIRSTKRSQDLTLPRHIAMHLACELMQLSTPRIGQAFENRKHSSVIYAHNRVKDLVAKDPAIAASVASLKRLLGY